MINSPIIEQFYNSMCKHEYKNIVIGLLSSYSYFSNIFDINVFKPQFEYVSIISKRKSSDAPRI
jgi:hypothetical protein